MSQFKNCDLCANSRKNWGGIYDFSRLCCVARYIVGMPSKQHRINFMDYIKNQDGIEAAEQLKKEVQKQWKTR